MRWYLSMGIIGPYGIFVSTACDKLLYVMKRLFEVIRPGDPEWRLAEAIDPDRLPAHIAIIMDGNGRWAAGAACRASPDTRPASGPCAPPWKPARASAFKALTLYAFSVENWKRPRNEVDALWRLLRLYLRRELPRDDEEQYPVAGASVALDALPPQVQRELESAIEATSRNRGLRVNLAINYGGRAEIVDAVNAILTGAPSTARLHSLQVDEEMIASRLYTASVPTPTCSSALPAKCASAISCCGRSRTPSCTSPRPSGPTSPARTCSTPSLEYQKRDRRFGGLSPAVPEKLDDSLAESLGVSAR